MKIHSIKVIAKIIKIILKGKSYFNYGICGFFFNLFGHIGFCEATQFSEGNFMTPGNSSSFAGHYEESYHLQNKGILKLSVGCVLFNKINSGG